MGQSELPHADELRAEYERFAMELPASDDLGLQYFTGYELAAREAKGLYSIYLEDLDGRGRYGVYADALGHEASFVFRLRKATGGSFRRLYAALSSVDMTGEPAFGNVDIVFESSLDGVSFARFYGSKFPPVGVGFQLDHAFADMPGGVAVATVYVRIIVRWNGLSHRYASLLGAAFAME
jgi:hypothetical protein